MRKEPKKTLLGYVAGIKYNSEGTIIDWLYSNKKQLCGHNQNPKIFKTKKSAENFINGREHEGAAYVREYYSYSY
jgi:hypothetical protein